MLGYLKGFLGEKAGGEGERGEAVKSLQEQSVVNQTTVKALKEGVSRVILTGIGEGPNSVQDHLIDSKGDPIKR